MKQLNILLLSICLLFTFYKGEAQINTIVTPKATIFPSTGLSYTEDPTKYFSVIMTNMGPETQQVYIGITISCQFSAQGSNFYMSTPTDNPPTIPLTISGNGGMVSLTKTHFYQLLANVNGSNITVSGMNWQDVLQLPEGQYQICITPYKWESVNGSVSPIPAGEAGCCSFSICYSGSAPEFTTPILGQGAGNLTNSNPLNKMVRDTRINRAITSDIRENSQYTLLPLQRNLIFRWTGVISNCLTSSNFNYILKIVEVDPAQNLQDAIRNNPTLATINNGSKLFYNHDTLTNRQFRLQVGHIYAAQVVAQLKNQSLTTVKLGNDGASQVITFVWGTEPVDYHIYTPTTSYSSKNNRADILEQIRFPYLVNPGKDQPTITALTTLFPAESTAVPADDSTITFVDNSYYQLKKNTTLDVEWMPVRSDSIMQVRYEAELYEYVGGDVNNSFNKAPLKTKTIQCYHTDNYQVDNHQLVQLNDSTWVKALKEGYKYVIRLNAVTDFSYANTITKTVTEYINGIPINNSIDSVVSMVGSVTFTTNTIFQWGVDSGALVEVIPAQITYPVDLSNEDVENYEWTEIKEAVFDKDFMFHWTQAKGLSVKDSVDYELFICKLKKGKKPDQCIKDTFLYASNIKNLKYIKEDWLDSLKVDESYVVYIQTHILSRPERYNLKYNGRSLLGTFKLIKEPSFAADLNNKLECHPHYLDSLSKTNITPKVDSLISNKVRLKMGEFPLVIQKAKFDDKKKCYSGEGYIVWKPFQVGECWIKVGIDSIQINDKFEVIKGSATGSIKDSSNYVNMGFGWGWSDWTDDKINKLAAKYGTKEDVEKYYKECNKYSNYVHGLTSIFTEGSASTGVLTLPLKVDDEMLGGNGNMLVSVDNMYFTPNTALMNLMAVYYSNEEDIYVPLVATNICTEPQGFLSSIMNGVDLYLAKSIEFELNDGYNMRLKASTQLGNPKDGTFLSLDDKGFKELALEVEFDMNSDLLGIDKKSGTPQKGLVVHANFSARIKDWDDWYAKIYMDPFAVESCEEFTFVPTGKGIFYDHSKKSTPKEISLPKGYVDSKERDAWQGFYMSEFSVLLSDEISNTFIEGNDQKDSMVIYKYGLNNTITDSVHYSYPGTRINFGAKDLIIDKDGFTVEIFARDLLNAETGKGGGWAFSLDTISVRFLKNKYKDGRICGTMGLPLFKGRLGYDCIIALDSLDFALAPKDSVFKFDLWAANIDFDTKSSYFKIHKTYSEPRTRINLNMSGKINIDFNSIDLPINFTLTKFEGMGMKNYNEKVVDKKTTVQMQDLDFTLGTWSWASPQKSLAGPASNGKGAVASCSCGGFDFTLQTIAPFFNPAKDGWMKIGLAVAGKIQFGNESFDIGAGAGFKIWGLVNPKNFDIKDFDGKLDSIEINTDLTVFKMEGKLYFFDSTDNKKYGDGFGGRLKVTVMDKVEVAMAAGFGTTKDDEGKDYKWWYVQGAASFPGPGFSFGVVSMKALGGGFAYNMECINNLADFSAKSLLGKCKENNGGGSFTDKMVSSGMEFKPSKNSWVAKAGISLALNNEKIMNADGILTLRIANGHFSGIMMNVDAYVLTKFDKEKPAGDGANNSNTLVEAHAIIGFERTSEYNYFRLSLCAEADISLQDILKDAVSEIPQVKDAISDRLKDAGYSGKELKDALQSEEIPNESNSQIDKPQEQSSGKFFDVSASLRIPIDLEIKHYRKGQGSGRTAINAGDVKWYFAVGKPSADECVRFDMALNAFEVFKTSAAFTFYLITGNSFAYQLPPLDPEVEAFFIGKSDEKHMEADLEDVQEEREIDKGDKLKFEDVGGFALGSTFKCKMEFSFFLYVKIMAALGFDVAMLDVEGQGCEGHPQVGKNNFYGMGRIYAMLEGSCGLKFNLGFWKGEFELFSAGIGALLQGGGPNPSWAYGLLRVRASCLGGLIKVSAAVDFEAGDVCIPGASDPLANVKLFQNVTPGLAERNKAEKPDNHIDPFERGVIISNMPWDRAVMLVEGQGRSAKARKFIFTLWNPEISYQTATVGNVTSTNFQTQPNLNFTRSLRDLNTYYFEMEDNGFKALCMNKVHLVARAFEWRTYNEENVQDNALNYPYNLEGKTKEKSRIANQYAWYDPTFLKDGDNKNREVKIFKADTTLYFYTKSMPENLYNQVVLTWPYNGEYRFPINEFYSEGGNKYALIYLCKDRPELLNINVLEKNGKELRIFLLGFGGEERELAKECDYTYHPTGYSMPVIKIKLPRSFDGTIDAFKIKLVLLEKDKYEFALTELLNKQQDVVTKQSIELQQRKLETGSSSVIGKSLSRGSNSSQTSSSLSNPARITRFPSSTGSTFQKVQEPIYKVPEPVYFDMQKQIYEENKDELSQHGEDTTMLYKRTEINEYAICKSVGQEIYALYFRIPYLEGAVSDYSKLLNLLDLNNDGWQNRVYFSENNGDYIKSPLWFGYGEYQGLYYHLFYAEYTNDPARYKTGIILPPICNLVIDQKGSAEAQNATMIMHKNLTLKFLKINNNLKNVLPCYIRYSQNGDEGFNTNTKSTGLTKNSSLDNEIKKLLSKGLTTLGSITINPIEQFKAIEFRTEINDEGKRYLPASYVPEFKSSKWSCPNILIIEQGDFPNKPMVDETFFDGTNNSNYVGGSRGAFDVLDYATPARFDDIKKFYWFLQDNLNQAVYFHQRGYSKKVAHLEYYYKNANKYKMFEYTKGFPYMMPYVYITSSYFNTWQAWRYGIRKNLIVENDGKTISSFEEINNSYKKYCEDYKDEVNPTTNDITRYWIQDWLLFTGLPNYGLHPSRGLPRIEMTNYRWTTVKSNWYNQLYSFSKLKIPETESCKLLLTYLTCNGSERFSQENFMVLLGKMAKDMRNSIGNEDALIYYPNAKRNIKWTYSYKLDGNLRSIVDETYSLKFNSSIDEGKYGMDK